MILSKNDFFWGREPEDMIGAYHQGVMQLLRDLADGSEQIELKLSSVIEQVEAANEHYRCENPWWREAAREAYALEHFYNEGRWSIPAARGALDRLESLGEVENTIRFPVAVTINGKKIMLDVIAESYMDAREDARYLEEKLQMVLDRSEEQGE